MHSVCMRFLWLPQQTVFIFLQDMKGFVFVREMQCFVPDVFVIVKEISTNFRLLENINIEKSRRL
jgi:hypothetical protein